MQNFDQNSPTIHILTNVSESRSIASLKIYNQSDQSGSNACDQSPCQHLCLPKPHNDYTCRCTLGYLLENETECKEDTKNDKVIPKKMFHCAQAIVRSCSCINIRDIGIRYWSFTYNCHWFLLKFSFFSDFFKNFFFCFA